MNIESLSKTLTRSCLMEGDEVAIEAFTSTQPGYSPDVPLYLVGRVTRFDHDGFILLDGDVWFRDNGQYYCGLEFCRLFDDARLISPTEEIRLEAMRYSVQRQTRAISGKMSEIWTEAKTASPEELKALKETLDAIESRLS